MYRLNKNNVILLTMITHIIYIAQTIPELGDSVYSTVYIVGQYIHKPD